MPSHWPAWSTWRLVHLCWNEIMSRANSQCGTRFTCTKFQFSSRPVKYSPRIPAIIAAAVSEWRSGVSEKGRKEWKKGAFYDDDWLTDCGGKGSYCKNLPSVEFPPLFNHSGSASVHWMLRVCPETVHLQHFSPYICFFSWIQRDIAIRLSILVNRCVRVRQP